VGFLAVYAVCLNHVLHFGFKVMFFASNQKIGMESSFLKEIALEIVNIFGRDGKK